MFVIIIVLGVLLYWFAPSILQHIQRTKIDEIHNKLVPSHEIWRKYEILKSATSVDWMEQERKEAEEKTIASERTKQERKETVDAWAEKGRFIAQRAWTLLTGIPGLIGAIVIGVLCLVVWTTRVTGWERRNRIEKVVKCVAWCLAVANLVLIYVSAKSDGEVFFPIVFAIAYAGFFLVAHGNAGTSDADGAVKGCGCCTLVMIAIIFFAANSNPPPGSPAIIIVFLVSCWLSVYMVSGKFTEWLQKHL